MFEKYENPHLAELANGEVKPIISGYLLADIELETPAGKVVLPHWHVDVLQGPTTDDLLYMGQREESELKLKSYSEQLTELAAKQNNGAAESARTAPKNSLTSNKTFTQVKRGKKVTQVVFLPPNISEG